MQPVRHFCLWFAVTLAVTLFVLTCALRGRAGSYNDTFLATTEPRAGTGGALQSRCWSFGATTRVVLVSTALGPCHQRLVTWETGIYVRGSREEQGLDPYYTFAGFGWFNSRSAPGVRIVVISHWFLLLATAALPVGVIARRTRRWRRRRCRLRQGRCPSCGYDVRETPNICPECGEALAAARQRRRPGYREWHAGACAAALALSLLLVVCVVVRARLVPRNERISRDDVNRAVRAKAQILVGRVTTRRLSFAPLQQEWYGLTVERVLHSAPGPPPASIGGWTRVPNGNLWIPMDRRQLIIETSAAGDGVSLEIFRIESDPSDRRVREVAGWIADAVAERERLAHAR